MAISRSTLSIIYIVIGFSAWVLTSLHLPTYLSLGFIAGTEAFWRDALLNANAAGKFLAVDIAMLGLAIFLLMATEARKHAIRGLWLYFLLAVFIGISLAVPLFLAARERAIRAQDPQDSRVSLKGNEVLMLILAVLLTLALGVGSFIA